MHVHQKILQHNCHILKTAAKKANNLLKGKSVNYYTSMINSFLQEMQDRRKIQTRHHPLLKSSSECYSILYTTTIFMTLAEEHSVSGIMC